LNFPNRLIIYNLKIRGIKMKLEIKKKLLSRSERVKSVELHPTLPWVLIGLYAGTVIIFDYNQQS